MLGKKPLADRRQLPDSETGEGCVPRMRRARPYRQHRPRRDQASRRRASPRQNQGAAERAPLPATLEFRSSAISPVGVRANCQTLVTKEGTIRSEAALAGAITRLSKPIETVGSPRPITPLTKPASRNVKVATMRGRCSTGTSDCETESTALGSLANSFHRRLRKNTIELATRKRISSAVALDPNTLAVTRLAATRGEPVTRSGAQTVSCERRRAAGKAPG